MLNAVSRFEGFLCVGIWTYLGLFRGGFWRLKERLPDSDAPTNIAATNVGVVAIVPARDEEDGIVATVESLRAQRHRVRVIVSDDDSSDGTAARASGAGAEVVRARPLPPGWKGKLWAVSEGVYAAGRDAEYLLLTDADIEYVSPDVLPRLLAKAAEGYDLVSLMVRLRCESKAERLLIPAFVFFFFMLYPPRWVANGRGPAAAAGGCMLIRRETLEVLGGMGAIRNALIDDCTLAQAVRRAGGRVWLGTAGSDVVSTRGYGRAADIRAMVARSAFAQLRHSAVILVGTVLGLVLTYLLPVWFLLSGDWWAAGLGGVAWLTSAAIFVPTVEAYGAPGGTAFALPLIAAFYLEATLESAINYWNGRGGRWKGRVQDT
jgi:hopene-associated glycosyltransferase HpnB